MHNQGHASHHTQRSQIIGEALASTRQRRIINGLLFISCNYSSLRFPSGGQSYQRLFKAFHGRVDNACAHLAHTRETVGDASIDHGQHI